MKEIITGKLKGSSYDEGYSINGTPLLELFKKFEDKPIRLAVIEISEEEHNCIELNEAVFQKTKERFPNEEFILRQRPLEPIEIFVPSSDFFFSEEFQNYLIELENELTIDEMMNINFRF